MTSIEYQAENLSQVRCATRLASFVVGAVTLVIAMVLLFSGVIHLGNPYLFLSSIIKYEIVSEIVARQMAICLPVLHVVLSVCLLSRFCHRAAIKISFWLFVVYAAAQISVLVRGLEIDCGCFGIESKQIGWLSIAGVAALAGLAGLSDRLLKYSLGK